MTGSFNGPLILHHRFIHLPVPSVGILRKPDRSCSHDLIERDDHIAHAAGSAARGGEKYVKSRDIYRRLNLLRGVAPVRRKFRYSNPRSESP